MAAVTAGRAGQRVLLLDGARTLGAKILVAGGGRCNVTHAVVSERDYAGGTPQQIKKVLQRFPVRETIAFFAALGVELKQESTGKLFPTTDRARTVLDALLRACNDAGVRIHHPTRIERVHFNSAQSRFIAESAMESFSAPRIVLATGGKALPKSGSDGVGYSFAQGFGHTLTQHIVPALAPLLLPPAHWLLALSGLALDVELSLALPTGAPFKFPAQFKAWTVEGALLATHFGLSGPAALDISRHWTHAHTIEHQVLLRINWLPQHREETLDALLVSRKGVSILTVLREHLPERFARAILQQLALDPLITPQQLPRERRQALVRALVSTLVEVTGDRGFTYAEATAGGVPLDEIDLSSMESRMQCGLFLVGEILDVDGRIGGFNFQWAWASGLVAGTSASRG
ncbi:MAG: aminoacetone oxidase family FAD-binding enzyme [Phycisphaerales bacterium]|nr:aminoacetone oxidase family FAD-binding enzyme [Phycisphaerales bacterium]